MKLLLHRKYFLSIITAATILTACSVSKETKQMRKNIDGSWYLKTIVTEGISANFKSKIFNESDFSCFIGSSWTFHAKKGRGTYAIIDVQKECPAVKRDIHWTVYEPKDSAKQFLLTRMDAQKKPMDNNIPFRFTISSIDNKEMKLRSDIVYNGHSAAIIYNFVKD